MANPKHLKIMRQGVEVWNKWRDENVDVSPDLSDVNLGTISFIGANLDNTNII